MGWDIIGDIHGHADKLVELLEAMGYRNEGGVHRHPERRAVFVGDLVDRGPHQRDTIRIARAMVDDGSAHAVMGNHEFNALAWATEDPDAPGAFLRPHTEKNARQHRAFLDAWAEDPTGREAALDWFRTLPLFLELDSGHRVIHACWDEPSRALLRDQLGPGDTLTEDLLVRASRRGTREYRAVETLLKGREIALPAGVSFKDKEGHERREMRVAWWRDDARTFADAWVPEPEHAPPELRGASLHGPLEDAYPADAPPVFFGHYWLPAGSTPTVRRHNVVCVDFSVARGGRLCAARTDGSRVRFCWV